MIINQSIFLELGIKKHNLYCYGSTVYRILKNSKSDTDFILITPNITVSETITYIPEVVANMNLSGEQTGEWAIDYSVYSVEDFQALIEQHEISALECLYLDPAFVFKEDFKLSHTLDLSKLRNAISAKASNSWVKAKKKFVVENEPYKAKKSLFHSLRILDFGIQIATTGKIEDYSSANCFWYQICNINSNDWNTYKQTFQPIYNSLSTKFRKVAPK